MNANPRRPTLASLRFEFFLRKYEKNENLKGFAPTTCYLVGARRYHYTTCEKNTFLCIQSASHLESGLVTKQNTKVIPKYFAYGILGRTRRTRLCLESFSVETPVFLPPPPPTVGLILGKLGDHTLCNGDQINNNNIQ